MPKATRESGSLNPISDCYIIIPSGNRNQPGNLILASGGSYTITLDNLPEISDTKSASYNDETIIGRSSPIKTYSQSDNRSISMQLHFIVSKPSDVVGNLRNLRAIQSACYPREGQGGSPFIPPPICRIKCGKLLSEEGELCVILKNYSVKFPTEIAWHSESEEYYRIDSGYFTPFKFDLDTTWDVVYASSNLPGQERIFSLGS